MFLLIGCWVKIKKSLFLTVNVKNRGVFYLAAATIVAAVVVAATATVVAVTVTAEQNEDNKDNDPGAVVSVE